MRSLALSLTTLLVLALPSIAMAQGGRLAGKVTDEAGKGLADVEAKLVAVETGTDGSAHESREITGGRTGGKDCARPFSAVQRDARDRPDARDTQSSENAKDTDGKRRHNKGYGGVSQDRCLTPPRGIEPLLPA